MSYQSHEFRARLRQLREHYIEQLPDKRDSIVALMQAVRAGDQTQKHIEDLRFIAHTLAGSGGSFGLYALSKKARALDIYLKALIERKSEVLAGEQLVKLSSLVNDLLDVQTDGLDDEILDLVQGIDIDEKGIIERILLIDSDKNTYDVISKATGSQVRTIDPFAERDTIIQAIHEFRPASIFVAGIAMEENDSVSSIIHALQQSGVELPIILLAENKKVISRLAAKRDALTNRLIKPLDVEQIHCLDAFRNRLATAHTSESAPIQRPHVNKESSARAPKTGNEATILYVEDNPVNIKFVSMIIAAECSYSLVVRDSAESALQYLDKTVPDLVLLDINLPGMDGYSALQVIRERPALQNVPVIALSGNALKSDKKRAEQAGFDAYLTKPINVGEMLDTINAFILVE